jgi:hypothetical protein
VPFNPFKRGPKPAAAPPPPADEALPGRPVPFEGLTEEWRLVGSMHLEGRLTDALNRREAIPISGMQWAPLDGSGALEPAAGLKSVDPYDLIVVLTGPDSLPVLTDSERAAHRVHKIPYDVALEVPPLRVVGTVHLYPGSEPERLLDRATEMFVPVSDAAAYLGELRVSEEALDTILVNRFYLRGVNQIDRRTMDRVQPLPGAPLGGTSWQDRAR